MTTPGSLSWAAGAGDGGDPDTALGGGKGKVGDDVAGTTPLGRSAKSQGRGIIAAGMILRTHMRTRPSVAERSHSLPGGRAYHTFTVILSLDRGPLKVDVLR